MNFSPTYIFQLATTLAGFLSSFLILKKDSKYLGNKFMAAATSLMGIYTLCIFVYDIIANEILTLILLPFGMACVLFGTMFIFFAMDCMVNSAKMFLEKKIRYVYLIFITIFGIILMLCANEYISFEEAGDMGGNINVKVNLIPLAVMVVCMLYFMIRSIFYVIIHGINKTEGESKKKMQIFTVGLLICVISVFINIASQFASDATIAVILDILTYLILAIGVLITSYGFLFKVK